MNGWITGWARRLALGAVAVLLGTTSVQAAETSQVPLYLTTAATPLMMLAMSRDEQLFKKAYPDYTDLNGDGFLDTTYQDAFNYSGYFDAKLCYNYSATDNRFKAAGVAAGANGHHCNGSLANGTVQPTGTWSGNFLNWVAMSRLDMLRFVLYGGNRVTSETATQTILERAHIPHDLHAWVKVYRGTDIGSFTPSQPSSGAISICNASMSSTDLPRMRVANGAYPEWASTALSQCRWAEDVYDRYTRTTYGNNNSNSKPANSCVGASGDNSCYDNAPRLNVLAGGSDGLVVQVEVCDPAPGVTRESFCRQYGSSSYKPAGLLQEYAEPDANQKEGKMRFGLLTGSYSHPRSGGVLRRNIGRLANNGDTTTTRGACQTGDEIDLRTGVFCNQTDGTEGIINTLSRFRISTNQTGMGLWNNNGWSDCTTYGILNRQNAPSTNTTPLANPGSSTADERRCSAWGNPISEIYAEALRYLAGEEKTEAFDTRTDLTGLPRATWLDPFREGAGGNPFCANCNVLVLSSGLSSFDSDEIPASDALERTAGEATQLVGDMEEITNGSYLTGRVVATQDTLAVGQSVNTHEDLCTAKTITSLGLARGICPDIPSQEGSFLMAGLAWQARTQDMRPDLDKPADWLNTITTYTVALAENLPKFEIAIGNNKITLAPLCQANNSGTATETSSDWRSCYLGSVSIGQKTSSFAYQTSGSTQSFHTYGRPLASNGSAGSFSLVWEDSQWGNDHDNDVVTMITYCVGSACNDPTPISRPGTATSYTDTFSGKDICWRSNSPVCTDASGSPSVDDDEVLIRVENLSAYAGNALVTGYSISGSDADGLKRVALRPGNANGSVLTQQANPPSTWARPDVRKYRLGTSNVKQLENPLWYTAKYGGFVTLDKELPLTPQDQGRESWDKTNTGVPDAYFKVTDPAKLRDSLDAVFSDVLARNSSAAAIATNSTRLDTDTLIYQAKFNSADWSGQLVAYRINANGTIGAVDWDTSVGSSIPTYASGQREIFTWNDQTRAGAAFAWANLSAAQQLLLRGTGTEAVGQSRLNWVAGNRSDEQVGASGTLRRRTYLLGDIINSDPFFVGQLNFGYEGLPAETPGKDSYATFRTGNRDRRKMLYVGANDGMLHGFDAETGAEVFAYVPAGAYRNLAALTDPNYQHRYLVDGSPNVGDAYINNAWKTVLIGTTGAGGSTVFALDITNPDSFGASNVLWEISAADTDFADLGATIGYATVGRMPNGQWVAVFGNGYGSANGRAVLYIVRLSDGQLIRKIYTVDCTTTCADSTASPNGLSTPALLVDGNRTIIAAYAGDLKGRLWKFDLSSSNSNGWEVAFTQGQNKYPLFTATGPDDEVQPITAPLEIGANPAGGYMIYFGTGQYYAVGDNLVGTNPPVQSFYGIWDKQPHPSRISTGRSALQAQEIIAEVTRTVTTSDNGTAEDTSDDQRATYNLRGVSATAIDWSTTTLRGWVLDLVSPVNDEEGERVVSAPRLRNGRVIFTTLIPSVDPCDAGGTSWLMEIDALTGGRLEEAVFDLDGNRLFNQGDYILVDGVWIPASGMQSREGIIKTPAITSAGEVEYKYAGGSKGGIEVVTERGGDRNGRQSWRQLR